MAERQHRHEEWSTYTGTLLAAEVAEKGNIACIQTSSGKIVAGDAATGLIPIGTFMETKTAPVGDTTIKIRLFRKVNIDWFANDAGGTPADAGDVGSNCYVLDAATVSMDDDSAGRSVAGRVWAVDSLKGVAVEMVAT